MLSLNFSERFFADLFFLIIKPVVFLALHDYFLQILLKKQSLAAQSLLEMFFLDGNELAGLVFKKQIELVYLKLLLWPGNDLGGGIYSDYFHRRCHRNYAFTSHWCLGACLILIKAPIYERSL